MSQVGYLIFGWGSGVVVLAAYAASVLHRSRKLAPMVPPERRRWVDAPDGDT